MEAHERVVEYLSAQIAKLYEQKKPFRIYHGSTNSTRQLLKKNKGKEMVDISSLKNVLDVNTETRTAIVEPNVPMDALVTATLKCDLVPLVVPEFPGITVGGAFSGTAAESSSFKHGFFDNSVYNIEIILADGTIEKASPLQNPDLFYGAAGSFGTLGVITLLKIKLRPAKKYVKLTYTPFTDIPSVISALNTLMSAESQYDYIDAIVFSPMRSILVLGRLTSKASHPLVKFHRASDPWFYIHASRTKSKTPTTFIVPLTSYLFRYDRGAFWMGSYSQKFSPCLPFNAFTRFLLNPLMRTRNLYKALHASGRSAEKFLIQDLTLPSESAQAFIDWLDPNLGIYPLWLCPIASDTHAPMHAFPTNPPFLLNVGVWGLLPRSTLMSTHAPSPAVKHNRVLEAKVKQLGGKKWLYAKTYYDESEFWDIYDRGGYEALRRKWRAGGLENVWEKVGEKVGEKVEGPVEEPEVSRTSGEEEGRGRDEGDNGKEEVEVEVLGTSGEEEGEEGDVGFTIEANGQIRLSWR
ncbi:MAG: hypothetical protein M1834_008409 [Cirrosporium novae-zelandiae]|nr:MAG: hypothetical protein M1834_008409 [Cirrosporium novae-zelandiae]